MRHINIALVIILAVVLLALSPMFGGRFFAIGDMRDVYIPIESFFHEQQINGHLPAWMPDAAWGFPVIASAQIGFFYPPLLLMRVLPVPIYFPLLLIVHFVWMSFGIYLLLRKFQLGQIASLLGAISFCLGGYVTLHLTHLNILLALSWLPWQFLACYVLATRPINFRSFTLLSLVFGIPFLAGQLQIPTLIAIVSAIWFIYLRYQRSYLSRNSLLMVVVIAIGAFLFAAAQLLPSLELMSLSTRAPGESFDVVRANQHSYPLYHLPTIVFPRFYANDDTYWGKRLQIEYGFYLGTIALLLAIFGIRASLSRTIKVKASLPAKAHKFFLYLFIISFLMSLGSYSPFRLIKLEPSLWIFSAPARWLLFSSFSLSVFAALGFDTFINNVPFYRKFVTRFLFLVLLFLVVINIGLFVFDTVIMSVVASKLSLTHLTKVQSLLNSAKHSSVSLLSPYSYLPLISIVSLWLFLKHRFLKYAVLIIVSAELIILFITTTPTIAWSEIIKPPQSFALLPDAVISRQSRLYSVREGGDTGAYFTNPESRANRLIRNQQRNIFVPLTQSQFGLSGIEWPASLDLASHSVILEALKKEGGYEIADLIMAADLNIGAVLSLDDSDMSVEEIDYKPRIQLVNKEGDVDIPYPASDPPSRLSFDVSTNTNASIIIRDSFYPGWHAYIGNDKEIAIYKYLLIFRRLFIPPGQYSITLKYEPSFLYLGVILSLMAFVITILSHYKYLFYVLPKRLKVFLLSR